MKSLNKLSIITLDEQATSREIDSNGYMIIRNNPIAKAGVFDYLGAEIGDPATDKIFKVYRPFEELEKVKDQFAGKPIILSHEWISPDNMPAIRGSITGDVTSEYPYLYADLTIYDAEAQDAINNGSYRELSPAYLSDYIKESGVTDDGEHYDYIQKNIKFNHLALVDNGRTGKDLKVMDENPINKKKGVQRMDENKEFDEVKSCDEDKRKLIDEIAALVTKSNEDFEGGEDEKVRTIIGLAEKLAYNPSETEEKTDDSSEVVEEEQKAGITVDDNTAQELAEIIDVLNARFKKFLGEEAKEPAHNTEVAETRTQDSNAVKKELISSFRAYDDVKGVTGNFNIYTSDSIMSEKEIYKYACKCIGADVAGVSDYKTAFNAFKQGVSMKSNGNAKTFDNSKIRKEVSDLIGKL